MRKIRGFLLFEVLLSVSILSIVAVFVIRSFSVSLRAAKVSQKYTQAVFLLEELIWGLEQMSDRDKKVFFDEHQGVFAPIYPGTEWREEFSWEINLEDLVDSEGESLALSEVEFKVKWPSRAGSREVKMITYLKNEG